MLEWLVQNKSTGDEEDVIEEVTAKTLETLISSVDYLVVLFCNIYYTSLILSLSLLVYFCARVPNVNILYHLMRGNKFLLAMGIWEFK